MIDNFVIFGHGKRVVENIIPALKSLNPNIKYTTYTKTGKYVDGYVYRETKKFKDFEISESIKNYIISVPPENTTNCINKIKELVNSKDINIFIDTPVHKNLHVYKDSSNISVLEDIKFLPWLDYFQDNKIVIKSVLLNQSGYEYHGVALAKQLIQEKVINSKRLFKNDLIKTTIKFENFKHVEILSPRNYKHGSIEIETINSEKYILGNKNLYPGFLNQDVIFLEDILDFQNDESIESLEKFNSNLKINPLNFVASMEVFKVAGLSRLFKDHIYTKNSKTTIRESIEEQNIASKNKNFIRAKKLLSF